MILDQLKNDLTVATRNSDVVCRDTLRLLLSAINYKKIDLGHDLNDEEVLTVINNEAKKRRESIDVFTKNNRPELAASEKAELIILETYLPRQLTREEIEIEIEKLDLPNDFGQAMKIVAPLFKGRADGKLVAEIIKSVIQ
ncbi:GatB/YqeY domain-containing protein [Candidatus Amesbacteria bacterium]|nr:GatB/YqeY domain-containing protein [Candidatus Amesbacteria bacterium]